MNRELATIARKMPRWIAVLGSHLDYKLAKYARGKSGGSEALLPTRFFKTRAGMIRAYDSGASAKPCVVLAPDGPNLIEHYASLINMLSPEVRVVCFDMPGFGYSIPAASYTHSLEQGAQVILDIFDELGIKNATLAFSCANGFYALSAARMAPDRINSLMLSQTPSLVSMHAWVDRTVPRLLRMPLIGQMVAWLFRKKMVAGWYRMALPSAADVHGLRDVALGAMGHGACFCLAGVVQGLMREIMPRLEGMETPCTMVWGAGDPSHAMTDPQSLLHCVPGARIVRFEDSGHFPDIEAHDRFGALLLEQVMRYAWR
jgi:pimeloyl-ACP methyl ester carboxylesterase